MALRIVVSGAPGTGKTTVAELLAERLVLPLLSLDVIKEALGDSLGLGDEEWSDRMGDAAAAVLFDLAAAFPGVVVEGWWRRARRDRAIQEFTGWIEVFCHCEPRVAEERMRLRAGTDRHPIHRDVINPNVPSQIGAVVASVTPLFLGSELIELDTTGPLDPDRTVGAVRSALDRAVGGCHAGGRERPNQPAIGDSVRRDREASGVNDLAEQFDATWLRFRAAVDDLGDAQMESPTRVGWTAKEMLGHLGFWLEATEGVIVGIFRGEPLRDDFAFESGYVPDPDAPWPTADVHNAREASWARSRRAAEVVARLDAGHAVFTSLLESLRADELTDDRYRNYVDHMCTEFDAHLEELQDLLLTA